MSQIVAATVEVIHRRHLLPNDELLALVEVSPTTEELSWVSILQEEQYREFASRESPQKDSRKGEISNDQYRKKIAKVPPFPRTY